jgi:hypothetical protein
MIAAVVAMVAAVFAVPAIDRRLDPRDRYNPPATAAPNGPGTPTTTTPGGTTTSTTPTARTPDPTTGSGSDAVSPPVPQDLPLAPAVSLSPGRLPSPTPHVPAQPDTRSEVSAAISTPRESARFATKRIAVTGTAEPPTQPNQLWMIVRTEAGRWFFYRTSSYKNSWSTEVYIGPDAPPQRTLAFDLILAELSSAAQASLTTAWKNDEDYNDNGMKPFSSGVRRLDTTRVFRIPS